MSANTLLYQLMQAETKNLDPGDGGSLSSKNKGIAHYAFVTATAETRALLAPLREGLIMRLSLDTDGGDCVVTSAVAINVAGNTIMTFADARDTITLVSIISGGTLYWSVMGNDGVDLS